MKILIIMPLASEIGGAEKTFMHLVETRSLEIEWLVVFLKDGPMVQTVKNLGIKTLVTNQHHLKNIISFSKSIFQIYKFAKKNQVDYFLSWMTKAHFYGGVAGFLLRKPVSMVQVANPSYKNWLDLFANFLPTKIIFTCSLSVSSAQNKLWPKHEIFNVYPGVDFKLFNPHDKTEHIRDKLKLPKGKLIGIFGRLQTWKGMHYLIKAMPIVLKEHSDSYCVIVGGKHDLEPQYEIFLKKLVKEMKLESKVFFAGFQTNIPEWMQAMDIIVHHSDNEPFGLVVIEAMAMGKPVISTNSGGPLEVIDKGVNGLLVPFGNSQALAAQINYILNNNKISQKLALNARKKSLYFSKETFALKIIEKIKKSSYENTNFPTKNSGRPKEPR